MLTQVMSSSIATAPSSTTSGRRTSPTIESRIGATATPVHPSVSG